MIYDPQDVKEHIALINTTKQGARQIRAFYFRHKSKEKAHVTNTWPQSRDNLQWTTVVGMVIIAVDVENYRMIIHLPL